MRWSTRRTTTPYGSILRKWYTTEEKYLSTHHQRDQETGLDYRGRGTMIVMLRGS
ncbi:MAG: hypothetical protein IPH63_07935 [Flavobacteriales bacterium]|nr:hypothetical protein [Flavobacteriales bacterium]